MTSAAARDEEDKGAIDILLVEDNRSYVELTLRALSEISGGDLRVEVAGTGERAVEILLGEKRKRPRLVILDIKLPRLSGHEVLGRVRSDPNARHIPVVMFTSSSLPADISESYRLGANGYTQRPLNFESYVKTLSDIIAYWLVVNISAPAE